MLFSVMDETAGIAVNRGDLLVLFRLVFKLLIHLDLVLFQFRYLHDIIQQEIIEDIGGKYSGHAR